MGAVIQNAALCLLPVHPPVCQNEKSLASRGFWLLEGNKPYNLREAVYTIPGALPDKCIWGENDRTDRENWYVNYVRP